MPVDSETVVLVVGGLLGVVGLALLWGGLRQYRHQRSAVRRATETSGTIERVGVTQVVDGAQTAYVPTVEYEYRTPTERLRGEQLYPGTSRYTKLFDSESAAETAIESYDPGASTTVYYDPDDPDHSFLDPTPHRGPTLARIAFGVVLLALGAALPLLSGGI